MPRKPTPPRDVCPYCGQGTSLQLSVAARHGRAGLMRSMWCASCRGTYLALRRLLPDLTVVDSRRSRPSARFDPEKLRRSISEPVRKPPRDGFRDPNTLEPIPAGLELLVSEFVLGFSLEELVRTAAEPNGEITTDEIAYVAMASLSRTHVLAFLRSAVHHRMMPIAGTEAEIEELAEVAQELVADIQVPSERNEQTLPPLREPPIPLVCPRCGMQRVARRSRASTVRGLEQQPASCSNCGQRYTWEWGAQVPLIVITGAGEALFEVPRFRAGIRSAVRRLPGSAAIWGDERLVESAANTASVNATPYIKPPTPECPIPSIDAGDLWLAAASALREIHPLAFLRYALHSRAIVGLDWKKRENARRQARMETVIQSIGSRYFDVKGFPLLPNNHR